VVSVTDPYGRILGFLDSDLNGDNCSECAMLQAGTDISEHFVASNFSTDCLWWIISCVMRDASREHRL
jgi:hypothetical protein